MQCREKGWRHLLRKGAEKEILCGNLDPTSLRFIMLRSQTSGYCVMQPLSRSSSSVSSCCSGLRENGTSEEEENDRELTGSLKGPPKQDSMIQSMWLDDSDCTPSTSSSPGSRLLPSSSVAGSTGKGKGSKAEAQHHNPVSALIKCFLLACTEIRMGKKREA
ncbi:hypothetical protein DV515_00010137 [Chloebia gouldiae]|uniref:Uncharacterized protein n=1 Tax=Chloebia gouldiae TaxID=44316 RepID=A0A3L8SAD6_CHLGU|nr:hypothetical protein DV515_00010137 [Chloebia gouldiae]